MRTYDQLIDGFIEWASDCEETRAAIQVGSRVRRGHEADEWADVDIMVFSTHPGRYVTDVSWLDQIGTVWISLSAVTAGGDPERLVLFEGGYNVDFVLMHVDDLRACAEAGVTPEIYQRGMRILVDKDGLASKLAPPSVFTPTYHRPSEEEFLSAVRRFWFGAVYNAKQLRRGNLWRVRLNESGFLDVLTKMTELHTHATRGWHVDTHYMGRFMEDWADPRILAGLKDIFPGHGVTENWKALFARMDLVRWMNQQTADRSGYAYPRLEDERATELVRRYYSQAS